METDQLYFNDFSKFPIVAIVGDLGSGKSTFTTFLAYMFQSQYPNILSNMIFNDKYIKYTYIEPDEMNLRNNKIKDGVLFIDEVSSSNGDAYEFFSKGVIDTSKFLMQVRKRNVAIFLINPRFNFNARRIRQMVNYYIEIEKINNTAGLIKASIFDLKKRKKLRVLKMDLRQFFDYFDTRHIIQIKEKPKETKVKKINKLAIDDYV